MASWTAFSFARTALFRRRPPQETGEARVKDTLSAPRGIALGLLISAVVWGILAVLLLLSVQ